jgi:hypothetical protein
VQPTPIEIAEALGVNVGAEAIRTPDVAVVGAGPAGLAAAGQAATFLRRFAAKSTLQEWRPSANHWAQQACPNLKNAATTREAIWTCMNIFSEICVLWEIRAILTVARGQSP